LEAIIPFEPCEITHPLKPKIPALIEKTVAIDERKNDPLSEHRAPTFHSAELRIATKSGTAGLSGHSS
jgi:hypothetical protein